MQLLMAALVVVNLQLVVRVYDSVGVPPADVERARASVGAILASVGIEPIWRPCHASDLHRTGRSRTRVVLRLVSSEPAERPGLARALR